MWLFLGGQSEMTIFPTFDGENMVYIILKLRLVFPSRTNSKSFHYFLLKFFVETVLDELSAKIHFSGAQEARKNFFSPNHLIYRGHSSKLQWLMSLLLNYSCTKSSNKENNRNRILNFNQNNFFFQISLMRYLEADFRKEKYFDFFSKVEYRKSVSIILFYVTRSFQNHRVFYSTTCVTRDSYVVKLIFLSAKNRLQSNFLWKGLISNSFYCVLVLNNI